MSVKYNICEAKVLFIRIEKEVKFWTLNHQEYHLPENRDLKDFLYKLMNYIQSDKWSCVLPERMDADIIIEMIRLNKSLLEKKAKDMMLVFDGFVNAYFYKTEEMYACNKECKVEDKEVKKVYIVTPVSSEDDDVKNGRDCTVWKQIGIKRPRSPMNTCILKEDLKGVKE